MSSRYTDKAPFTPLVDEMRAIVRGLYLALLGREPDAPGLAHWVAIWEAGSDLSAVANGLMSSEEYKSRPMLKSAMPVNDRVPTEALPELLSELPLVIVDVGAQNLSDESHIYSGLLEQSVPCRIIGFEPLEHRRRERLDNDNTGLTLLPAFIGDGREHVFHLNEPDATSSLLPFNRAVTDRLLELAPLRTIATEPALTSTLDEALVGEAYVDLLKLDIQGFELTALRYAKAVLQRTLVVHCEVSFAEIYKGQALFSEVEQYMRAAGFDLVDFSTLCRYPFANTAYTGSRDWLGWGDAVFFRRLDKETYWRETFVQSLIALVVYRKRSLAAWLAGGLENTPASSFMESLIKGDKTV